jgi:hypothetical protein
LQAEGYFVGGDGALAQDRPRTLVATEVDDGGGAAVDDHGDLIAELVADAAGPGALGQAVQIGGGCGDGKSEFFDDCTGNRGFGDAQGDVSGVSGNAQGKFGAGFDDDGEGAGPETFGEAVEGGVAGTGERIGVGDVGDEERERLVAGTLLDLVDAVDGAEIDGVDGEPVEGVSGKSDDLAGIEGGGDTLDERGLGLVGMDAEDFGRQDVRCSQG